MDGILDIIEEHRAFFWPFIVMFFGSTIWEALRGGGWGSAIAGLFIGAISGLFVTMGLKKLRGQI